MQFQISSTNKEMVLTKNTYGAVVKKGYVVDKATGNKRIIDIYTIVKVCNFNFATHKVELECIKGVDHFVIEADVKFLMEHCELTTPDENVGVEGIMIQHVCHNMLDKDTAIFIIVMTLTYLVGLILGKGLL